MNLKRRRNRDVQSTLNHRNLSHHVCRPCLLWRGHLVYTFSFLSTIIMDHNMRRFPSLRQKFFLFPLPTWNPQSTIVQDWPTSLLRHPWRRQWCQLFLLAQNYASHLIAFAVFGSSYIAVDQILAARQALTTLAGNNIEQYGLLNIVTKPGELHTRVGTMKLIIKVSERCCECTVHSFVLIRCSEQLAHVEMLTREVNVEISSGSSLWKAGALEATSFDAFFI